MSTTKQDCKTIHVTEEINKRAIEFLTCRLLVMANDIGKNGAWLQAERERQGLPGSSTEKVHEVTAQMVIKIVRELNDITPAAKEPDAPDESGLARMVQHQADAWCTVFNLCLQLGMPQSVSYTGIQRVCEFIRGLWKSKGPKAEQPATPGDTSKGVWFGHEAGGVVIWTLSPNDLGGEVSAVKVDGKEFVPKDQHAADCVRLVRKVAECEEIAGGSDWVKEYNAIVTEAARLCPKQNPA